MEQNNRYVLYRHYLRYNWRVPEIKFLLKISRPRFWIYVFGPYLIGLVAAAQDATAIIRFESVLFGIYFLFPANLLVYGINDIFDYETDKLNPKKQNYETLVTPDYRLKLVLYICLFNLPFLITALFYPLPYIEALFGFLFFSIFYSAKPIRAKTKPLLDSLFNILYVFPGVCSYVLISGEFPPFLPVLGAGLWTMAMHAYSAIPDIDADREANINTIATFLGVVGTLGFCLICYSFSSLISYQFIGFPGILLGLCYFSMVFASFVLKKSERIFEVYRLFPILNTVTGFILFWTIAYPKFI